MTASTDSSSLGRIVGLPMTTALLVLTAASCGGGGGGGDVLVEPPEPPTQVNEGSYTVDDFEEPEERPAGYEPLGTPGFQALSREELFVVVPTVDGEGRIPRLQEDPGQNQVSRDEIVPLFSGEGVIHAVAFGQLDTDADAEMVVATVDATETRIDLHLLERSANGGPLQRTWLRSVAAQPWNFEDVRLSVADVDGDFLDEILLSARERDMGIAANGGVTWVFDDPAAGAAQMFEFGRNARHISIEAIPGDVDGDGDAEVIMALGGDTTDDGRFAIQLYDWDDATSNFVRRHGWFYLEIGSGYDSGHLVSGDFDADGRHDLAWLGTRRSGARRIVDVRMFGRRAAPAPEWESFATTSLIDISGASGFGYGDYAGAAFRRSRRGDDLACVMFGGSSYSYRAFSYDPAAATLSSTGVSLGRAASDQTIALTAGDVDADGIEEVQVALVAYPGSGAKLDLAVVEHEAQPVVTWQDVIPLGSGGGASGRVRRPVLAMGDFDVDGFAVQATGQRDLRLADPIPLVVLAAAPTQAGISQNYDDTESAYSTGTTRGESIGVSNYTSLTTSVSAGATLFGVLGVEGRASFERGVARTETSTQQETVVRGFRGSSEDDVIVFQGTLYEAFEYRIVGAADPTLIGSLITLDLPIDTKTYKWTVDYYNDRVDPDDQIEIGLRTHTPGDAGSYPTRGELDALIGSDNRWDMAGGRAVGQGTASDFESVSFATVRATEEERTLSRSFGGGASFGVSVSVDATSAEGSTHSVFFESETTFEAAVGDIEDPTDYVDWQYSWGFAIQTVGRGTQGYSPRKHVFQYLRFWVEPTGAAY